MHDRYGGRLQQAEAHFQTAHDLARQLVRDEPTRYDLRVLLANMSNGLAGVLRDRGQVPKALATCEAGRKVCEQLAADYPHYLQAQATLADNCSYLGGLYAATSRADEARRLLEKAQEVYTAVTRADPHVLHYQVEQARAHAALGSLHYQTGQWTAALASLEEAHVLWQKLTAAQPALVEVRVQSAGCLIYLGNVQQLTGQRAASVRSYQEAAAVYEKLVEALPSRAGIQMSLGSTYNNLSVLQAETGAYQDAIRTLAKGRLVQECLVKAFPDVPAYQNDLAGSLMNLGKWQDLLGKVEEGLQLLRQAAALREKLVQAQPAVLPYQALLAETYRLLGIKCQRAADALSKPAFLEEAHQCLARACTLAEALVSREPANAPHRDLLVSSYNDLAEVDRLRGRPADALRELDQARARGAALVRDHPAVPGYQSNLARAHFYAGKAHAARKEFLLALAAYWQARDLQEKLVQVLPQEALHQVTLADTCRQTGLALWALGRRDEAVAALRQAAEHLGRVYAKNPAVLTYRQVLSRMYAEQGWVLGELGRHEELSALARKRQELWPGDFRECYFAAVEYTCCLPWVGKGKKDLSSQEQAERERYAAAALDALRDAVRQGFRNRKLLETAPAFAPLRGRPEFAKLLAELPADARTLPK
jgi:tetratricopeptide (TPR) repeat protein